MRRWSSATIRRYRLTRLQLSGADWRAVDAAIGRLQWWTREAPNDNSPRAVAAHREGNQDGFLNRHQRARKDPT